MSDSKQHGKRRKAFREAVQGVTGPLSGSDRSGRGSSHGARGYPPSTPAYPWQPYYGDGSGTYQEYQEQTGPDSHEHGFSYQGPTDQDEFHHQSSQGPDHYASSSYEAKSHQYSGPNQDPSSRLYPPRTSAQSHAFASSQERLSQSASNPQGREPRIVEFADEMYLVTEEYSEVSVQVEVSGMTLGSSSDPNAAGERQELMRRAQDQMQTMLSSGRGGRLRPSGFQAPHFYQSQQSSSPHPVHYSKSGQGQYSTHSQQSASPHFYLPSFGSQSYSHQAQPPHQAYSGFDTLPPQAHAQSPYPAHPPPGYDQATGGSQCGTNHSAHQPEKAANEYQYGPGQGGSYQGGGGSNYGEGNSGNHGDQYGGAAAGSYGGSNAGGYGTEGGYGGGGGSQYGDQQNQYGSGYSTSGGGYGGYGDNQEDTWARFAAGNGGGYI